MNWKSIFNPFEKFDEKLLLCIGILTVIISIGIGYWTESSFSSIYRINNLENPSLKMITASTLISFSAAIVVLFILGKCLNKKTRIIDIVNTVLISQLFLIILQLSKKIPYIKTAGKNIVQYQSNTSGTFPFLDFVITISMTIIAITILIYSFTLYYNGFKTATNIKKWQHIVLFCAVSLISILICQITITKII
ncbi:YIP1 family protein [Chryseobacterium aurantiacum]|uniref:YIP1 family protein n=1 Tax=Chryseobacterium aurantiacum TaxID=2116499 RepID=UPI000D131294|nr:YIP1 family protein [Chryseobacterium aurantiacum]